MALSSSLNWVGAKQDTDPDRLQLFQLPTHIHCLCEYTLEFLWGGAFPLHERLELFIGLVSVDGQ